MIFELPWRGRKALVALGAWLVAPLTGHRSVRLKKLKPQQTLTWLIVNNVQFIWLQAKAQSAWGGDYEGKLSANGAKSVFLNGVQLCSIWTPPLSPQTKTWLDQTNRCIDYPSGQNVQCTRRSWTTGLWMRRHETAALGLAVTGGSTSLLCKWPLTSRIPFFLLLDQVKN